MKKPKWNPECDEGVSVDIPEIDVDHKRFMSQLDELNRSITETMKVTEIKKRLQLIVEDVERHFAQEEKIFQELRYPNSEGHARSHNQILNTLKNIQESFMPYGLEAEWLDATLTIKSILISHFITEDMQYAKYFKSIILKY